MARSEEGVWTGSARSWLIPTIVATFSLYSASQSEAAIMYVFAFLISGIVVHFCSVHVRLEDDAVVYGFGAWMWPKRSLTYDQIERVDVIDVEPLKYGGWGLRGSRHAIARRGPGLLLHLGGSRAVVTVDGPDEAAHRIRERLAGGDREAPARRPT